MNKTKTIGIILAGGSGSRFSDEQPKQFIKLAGRLVIEYSLEIFEKNRYIDEILVVVPSGYSKFLWEIVNENNFTKITKIINGGNSRNASTLSALQVLKEYPGNTKIIIHDAARPLVEDEIVNRCIKALDFYQAVDVAIPSADTIVEVNNINSIIEIPNRDTLRCGQTPQGFLLHTISSAYSFADLENLTGITCDCSLLLKYNKSVDIKIVNGESSNIKITNPIDLHIAEKIIQTKIKKIKSNSYIKIKNKVFVIFGGSSGIGAAIAKMALENNAIVHIASRTHNGVDITNPIHIEKFLNHVSSETGNIDIVINTAGILLKKPLSTSTEFEISDVINTNLTSSIEISKKSYPYLRESRGCLVNFSSSSYTRGRAFYATYSATKAAIVNLTQALAEEWHKDGIKVICISPERTKTPMRVKNFGLEADDTLLNADVVASETISAICSNMTGVIFDVRREK